MMKCTRSIKQTLLSGFVVATLAVAAAPATRAAPLDLIDIPLLLDLGVEPNIVVSMDESGSMRRCFILPGGIDDTDRPGVFEEYDPDFEWGTAHHGVASPDVNLLYYNPDVEYGVPVDGDGVPLAGSNFGNAPLDGFGIFSGATEDLASNFKPCWHRPARVSAQEPGFVDPFNPGVAPAQPPDPVGRPAYYTRYTGPTPASQSDLEDDSNFTVHVIGTGSDPSFGGDATKQQNNFATWFTYYRNRINVMKSAASLAFIDSTLDDRVRLAHQDLWGLNGSSSNRTDVSLMKLYTGQARRDFYNFLFALNPSGGTPLRYTLDKVGQYYMNQRITSNQPGHGYTDMADKDSPWAFDPGTTTGPEFTCRQAFHVMLTDGLWNNDAGVSGNVDNQGQSYPKPLDPGPPASQTAYAPFAPYKDSNFVTGGDPNNLGPALGSSSSGTQFEQGGFLADTAFHYWITDLRTDLTDDVPKYMPDLAKHPRVGGTREENPKNDPATWQHLVNYLVAFGVDGDLTFNDTTYNTLLDGTLDWPLNQVDDLWHAAINSRGQYLNAKEPQELVSAFKTALNAVLARTGSGAAVALNSGTLTANSRIYQGRFDSGRWTGQLLAFDILSSGPNVGSVVTDPPAWDAAVQLNMAIDVDQDLQNEAWDTGRTILTYDGSDGIPFTWAAVSAVADMEADLNTSGVGVADEAGQEEGQARLQYLRGDNEHEDPAKNNYRERTNELGDIIGSGPVFVGEPAFNYPNGLEAAPYSSFKSVNDSRTPVVYVGTNDGMLHGFDADTGDELIAYVPKAVFPNLTRLTATDYSHRFFVDGTPTVVDAFFQNDWHTVLAGGLGKGGQAIYALDVTNPASFSEAATNAKDTVLWEFTDEDDADLGYTFSRPAIVRMQNGKWAVVFGNGYNNTEAVGNVSTSGNAVLYIAFIEGGLDGTWTIDDAGSVSISTEVVKFDTNIGKSQDPASADRPNGLATVAPVDIDGDRIMDYIYAGDLFGNMWKFDVTSADASNWDIAYGGQPLYTAVSGSGIAQPITSRPEVSLHPQVLTGGAFDNGGYMIFFGTGKYLEGDDNDITSEPTQTFYAIWDPDESSLPANFDRSSLLQQEILAEQLLLGSNVRITSDNDISWRPDPLVDSANDHIGWYMDLINTGGSGNRGERQVTTSVLRGSRIIFTTLIPAGDSCIIGGTGFLMELDLIDGSRLGEPPFDIDEDGNFDNVNFNGEDVAPGGIESEVGGLPPPAIIQTDNDTEYKYLSGTDQGNIQVILEQDPDAANLSGSRESWRQLQ